MTWHLTVDVGNSEMASVLYRNEGRVALLRTRTHPHPDHRELRRTWAAFVRDQGAEPAETRLTISNVVPALEPELAAAVALFGGSSFHRVGWGSPHPFSAADSARAEIGSDLVAGLVGARRFVRGAFAVIDCGTATTLTLVDGADFIHGVAIMPGLKTQLLSLTRSAPHLPQEIDLSPPPLPYGNDTREALQSGIVHGHAAAIEGLLARYRRLLEPEGLTAVGCGGLFHRVATLCSSVELVEPELVNIGCRILGCRAGEVGSPLPSQEGI